MEELHNPKVAEKKPQRCWGERLSDYATRSINKYASSAQRPSAPCRPSCNARSRGWVQPRGGVSPRGVLSQCGWWSCMTAMQTPLHKAVPTFVALGPKKGEMFSAYPSPRELCSRVLPPVAGFLQCYRAPVQTWKSSRRRCLLRTRTWPLRSYHSRFRDRFLEKV